MRGSGRHPFVLRAKWGAHATQAARESAARGRSMKPNYGEVNRRFQQRWLTSPPSRRSSHRVISATATQRPNEAGAGPSLPAAPSARLTHGGGGTDPREIRPIWESEDFVLEVAAGGNQLRAEIEKSTK